MNKEELEIFLCVKCLREKYPNYINKNIGYYLGTLMKESKGSFNPKICKDIIENYDKYEKLHNIM